MATRESSIPAAAVHDEASETWQIGPDKDRWQIWHPCGLMILDASYRDGQLHGPLRFKMIGASTEYGTDHHKFCLGLIAKLGLPDGDDLSELVAMFEAGQLREARFVVFMGQDNELEKLSATFGHAGIERLRWKISGSDKIFAFGDLNITRKDMKVPKPWPAAVELGFVKGKIKTRAFLDKNGVATSAAAAPKKLTEWGQAIQSVDGYLASGQFATDIKEFFPDAKFDNPDPDAKRANQAFATLPGKQREAAQAFDAVVTRGFPALSRAQLSGYGFDCVKHELHAANDPKYFGLAYTCDGDLQLLDLETGRVVEWVHDYAPFEDDAVFPSLDAYAFALLRIELAAQKRIPPKDAAAVFERLGFGWAKKLI